MLIIANSSRAIFAETRLVVCCNVVVVVEVLVVVVVVGVGGATY